MLLRCAQCRRTGPSEEVAAYARYKCLGCGAINEVTNIPLKEWLGFNYAEYLASIKAFINGYEYAELAGISNADFVAGRFTEKQITALKGVLSTQFDRGGTIREIRDDIMLRVKPKKLKVYRDGDLYQVIPTEVRSLLIARTETTRAANEGAKQHYLDGGVEEYRWLASFSERTCPDCEALNGQVFPITSARIPPLHPMCRCTTVPVTRLG